ncbi:MAG: hypothetical protein JNL96_01050 [Planctomycetaceae bacterium]|nr:hypothetical protein [Planctomycetaceae bacterium]
MSLTLPYGIDSQLEIALDEDHLIGVCGAGFAVGRTLRGEDFHRALRETLERPLEFPSLEQAVLAGDKVTIAVEPGLPRAVEIVTAVAQRLIDAGVAFDDLTILTGDAEIGADAIRVRAARATVPPTPSPAASDDAERTAIRVERHDPADRGKLGFLSNTRSGRPVYLNRLLTDADLTIPVGCFRGPEGWSYRGVFGGLYPTFSDRETQTRFRNPHLLDADDETFAKSQHEIDLIGWQSGTQFTVQVVPGAGDEAAAVIAGEMRAVVRRAAELWKELWRCELPETADLVVASLSGERAQNWDHVARALAAALKVVDDGGAIALCTELNAPLGPGLELFSKTDDRDAAVVEVRKARPVDAFAALMLDRAQRRVRVYLLSKLDASTVEDLGLARVDEAADIGRLAARRRNCILLSDAQHASPSAA